MAQVAPPAEARVGPARPGGLKSGLKSGMKKPASLEPEVPAAPPAADGGGGKAEVVTVSKEAFLAILTKIRTNELLGAAAADALEVLAGLKEQEQIIEQSPKAAAVRKKVAGCRMGAVEDIPDAVTPPPEEEEDPPKKRASLSQEASIDMSHDAEDHEAKAKDAPEPPELNLNVKQNKLRTDLEMWVMDAIPELYGVDDSEELDEDLQEDGQADKISFAIAELDPDKMQALVVDWVKNPPDADAATAFVEEYCTKVRGIQDLGAKKKKKKKKADAEA